MLLLTLIADHLILPVARWASMGLELLVISDCSLDNPVAHVGHPLLASATFMVLRFPETQRVFAVTVRRPVARARLRLLSSNSVQRFVNKRVPDELLVAGFGTIWREYFEDQLMLAMQKRREGVLACAAFVAAADGDVRERIQ